MSGTGLFEELSAEQAQRKTARDTVRERHDTARDEEIAQPKRLAQSLVIDRSTETGDSRQAAASPVDRPTELLRTEEDERLPVWDHR